MDLRQLRYFVTVAEEMNITRAAEKLNMTQPPLSRQLQQIEADVGLPLFERGARPLRMTEAGRIFYTRAKRLIDEAAELAPLTRQLAQLGERIVIGFVPSAMYASLPPVIRAFRETHPGVELTFLEMFTLAQLRALKAGHIDVGFGRLRFDDPHTTREVLLEERMIVALPAAHRLANERSSAIAFADLANETVIVYPSQPRPSYADQQLSAFHDRGLQPAATHEVRELQTALGLVAAGVGISLVPESVAAVAVPGVSYRRLPGPDATSPIIMSRRLHDSRLALLQFCDVARMVFGQSG